jgi:glutamate-1-semialdehyde 2,1-aminomutase
VLDEVIVVPFKKPAEADRILRMHAHELACVLVDPMPSRAGLIPASQDYLDMLWQVKRDTGVLLVFDEAVSFRLGYAGAQGLMDIEPDLTTIAKIIGGGFPIGAVAGKEAVMAVFDPRNGKLLAPHGGTFNANPISMVAGTAAMELLTPEAFERLNELGDYARAGARKALEASGMDGQVTGAGSLLRIHMTNIPLVDYRAALPTDTHKAALTSLVEFMYAQGILISETGVCALSTPMGEAEIDKLIETLTAALAATGEPRHAAE